MIFEIIPAEGNYNVINFVDEASFDIISFISDFTENGPLSKTWRPPSVRLVPSLSDQRPALYSDFPFFLSHPFGVSSSAAEILKPFISGLCELLPLDVEGVAEEFFFLKIVNASDVLDETSSNIERFDDGRIMRVHAYAFHREKERLLDVFRLPFPSSGVFVSQRVADLIRESSLQGITFNPVFDISNP